MESITEFIRVKEWLHIIGVPIAGYFLGVKHFKFDVTFLFLIIVSFLSLSFAYSFNEYFDHKRNYGRRYFYLSLFLLLTLFIFAVVMFPSTLAFIIGGAILVILYSHPLFNMKSIPFVGTLINSTAFSILFLIGFAAYSMLDIESILMGTLIFSISTPFQLTHEIEHIEQDKRKNIKTTAVMLGKRKGLLILRASLFISSGLASLFFILYGNIGVVAGTLALSAILYKLSFLEDIRIVRRYMRYCGILYGILLILSFVL